MSESLSSIYMTSGVNDRFEGFVTVAAHGDQGTILIGQLSPDQTRDHALAYLGAAEAAEQDAAVLRCVRKLGLPSELAGAVIAELREGRDTPGEPPASP